MYCVKCGTENEQTSTFCKKCGTKIISGGQAQDRTVELNAQIANMKIYIEKLSYAEKAIILSILQMVLLLFLPLFGSRSLDVWRGKEEVFGLFKIIGEILDGGSVFLVFGVLLLIISIAANVFSCIKLINKTVDNRFNLISIITFVLGGAIIYFVNYQGIFSSFDITSIKYGYIIALVLLVLTQVSIRYSQELQKGKQF